MIGYICTGLKVISPIVNHSASGMINRWIITCSSHTRKILLCLVYNRPYLSKFVIRCRSSCIKSRYCIPCSMSTRFPPVCSRFVKVIACAILNKHSLYIRIRCTNSPAVKCLEECTCIVCHNRTKIGICLVEFLVCTTGRVMHNLILCPTLCGRCTCMVTHITPSCTCFKEVCPRSVCILNI